MPVEHRAQKEASLYIFICRPMQLSIPADLGADPAIWSLIKLFPYFWKKIPTESPSILLK